MKKIDLKEFRKSGLLWFINRQLHLFGIALVIDTDKDMIYPIRCDYRGFSEESEEKGYKAVTDYLLKNIEDIEKDFE